VFFSGTAVEIQPISSINNHLMNAGEIGIVTSKIKRIYDDIVKGKRNKYLS
jgi:branched-chain amino acid aminotransferase